MCAAFSVYKTTNGGDKWTTTTGSVGVFPTLGFIAESAGSVRDHDPPEPLQASSDGGVTWNPPGTGLAGSLSKIIVDPANDAHVIRCFCVLPAHPRLPRS